MVRLYSGVVRVGLVMLAYLVLTAAPSRAFIIDTSANPWLTTASGSRTDKGQPATLTWGLVPDGTSVYNGATFLGNSGLIAALNTQFSGDPLESDHRLQPWFEYFDDSFNRWSNVSGLTYVYEPNDTGQALPSVSGVKNVRADVRIGGVSVDGSGGTLAFNYFPDVGEMVLDTDDMGFFGNPVGGHVQIRNTIMHEAGHGLGYQHINSDTDIMLMRPSISIAIDGPQLDEVRAAHFYYGDANEKSNGGLGNGTAALATGLGTVLDGATASVGVDADIPDQAIGADDIDFVSLSNDNDTDFYAFTVTEASTVDLQLTPLGGQFTQASQGATPTAFDATARADLALQLWATDGTTLLGSVDAVAAGGVELIEGIELLAGGEYYASITTVTDTVQLYRLDVSVESILPIVGDLNGDGFVGVDDLDVILNAWNQDVPPGDPLADPSEDGFVGIADLDIVLNNWNAGTPPTGDASIPEPGTAMALLGLGAGALVRCRAHR